MKPLELFRLALTEIGDASAAELSDHLEKHHGVRIPPAYIPLYRATVHDLEKMANRRQDAKSIPANRLAQAA